MFVFATQLTVPNELIYVLLHVIPPEVVSSSHPASIGAHVCCCWTSMDHVENFVLVTLRNYNPPLLFTSKWVLSSLPSPIEL